jgi:hypothetical protein
VEENAAEAGRYYKMSADGGLVLAQLEYGDLLMSGERSEEAMASAERYYEMSAGKGNREARARLERIRAEREERARALRAARTELGRKLSDYCDVTGQARAALQVGLDRLGELGQNCGTLEGQMAKVAELRAELRAGGEEMVGRARTKWQEIEGLCGSSKLGLPEVDPGLGIEELSGLEARLKGDFGGRMKALRQGLKMAETRAAEEKVRKMMIEEEEEASKARVRGMEAAEAEAAKERVRKMMIEEEKASKARVQKMEAAEAEAAEERVRKMRKIAALGEQMRDGLLERNPSLKDSSRGRKIQEDIQRRMELPLWKLHASQSPIRSDGVKMTTVVGRLRQ